MAKPSDILFNATEASLIKTDEFSEKITGGVDSLPSDSLFELYQDKEQSISRPSDVLFNSYQTEKPIEKVPDITGIAKELAAESLREKDIGGDTIQGKFMTEMLAPSVEEYDKIKTNPILTEQFKKEFTDTIKGYGQLAMQPLEIVRGGAEFVLSLPGFALGILGAGQKIVERMGRPFTFNDLYDAASEGMEDLQTYWGEKMVEPLLGKPTAVGQLVGQTAMAPALGIAMAGQYIASAFEGYPNVQGLTKFAGDIGGLVALGRIYRGSKAELTAKTEEITEKARDIANREQLLPKTLNESLRAAQEEVLKTEKIQLELEAAEVQKNLNYEKMIKEDLSSKSKQIKQIKQPQREILDEQIDRALEKLPEEKVVEKEVRKKFERTEPEVKEPSTDLDLQTGTREPVEFSTKRHPLYESDPDAISGMAKVYAELKSVAKNIDELFDVDPTKPSKDVDITIAKLTNDVNRYLKGEEIDIEGTRNFLSDIAIRIEEVNTKKLASDAAQWARKADRIKIEPSIGDKTITIAGTKIKVGELFKKPEHGEVVDVSPTTPKGWFEVTYEDGFVATTKAPPTKPGTKLLDITQVPAETVKTLNDLYNKAKKSGDVARGLKAFKPIQAAKNIREEFNRSFIDRSGNIRSSLLKSLGDVGYDIVQKMYLSKGASSLSASMLKQMSKEIYGGLSRKRKNLLDDLIFHTRMIDLAKYKTEKKFKYFKKHSPKESAAFLSMFEAKEKLTDKEAYELYHVKEDGTIGGRVGAYYEWLKKPLRDMLETELISEKEYDALASHNYRRLKLVDLYDKRQPSIGRKGRTVYDSGVESLSRGRETDIFERSSEVMALEVFNRSYGRILNNKANQSLLELAKNQPENPFVRVKKKKGDKIPSGWNRIFVFEEGQRKAIYLSPEMSKEWITNSPEMSYKASQILRYASGSPVLRTFATGINWGFALANLPRDIMHTWYTARAFEDGKWKPVYNPTLPVFAMQIGRDLATVFTDAALRKGRYEQYIKEGGGMEFLVHQGRLFQRGRHVEGRIDKAMDFFGYFGETSEIMTRLAIRERAMRRGKSAQEATFIARDYMDFGQGGGIAKAADNAIPYLNAAIQGTRGLFRSFKPGSGSALSSTYKLAQFAALTSGLYIAMQKMHPESSKALRGNIDMQNNICLPLGDAFGFEDEKGQMRYPYLKWPLDPGQKFFKTFFEGATDKWLGNEVDVNRIVDSLKEQSPVSVTELPPTISGALGYVTNKDFWLNEDIWRKTDKPFGYPESKEEFIPGKTPQAYIDLGASTGLSPERTKFMVEELTTNGTVWSYLLGQGYDAAFGDLPKSKKEQHLAMVLSKIPVIKRFFGVTNPYSQFAGAVDEAKEQNDIKRWIQNRGLDMRVEGYLYDKNVERKEVIDYMRSFKDKKIHDRLKDRFVFQEKIKDLPNRSFWLRMKGLTIEARARVYADRVEKATETERKQLNDELQKIIRIGGVITKDFRSEVMRLNR